MRVNTFENYRPYPEPDDRIFSFFLLSSLSRLAQHSLDLLPWLTHKSVPFCHVQVHNVSVFDKRHFDHYRFYQCYTYAFTTWKLLIKHAQLISLLDKEMLSDWQGVVA